MTETVEVLSMRVVQLENALCEQQDVQESLEAEEAELKKRLQESEEKCSGIYPKYLETLPLYHTCPKT